MTTSDCLISVVIPVYNTPIKKIARCLNSICSDDMTALEAIVVDDGSKPEFSASYRSLCGAYQNIHYYHKENGGAAQARNYGMERTSGDYITFVDADDYISPSCLRQARWIIEKEQPDLIVGLLKLCGGNNDHAIEESRRLYPDTQLFASEEERLQLLGQMFSGANTKLLFPNGYIGAGGPVAKMIRRERLQKVKFDEALSWSEDMVWNIQLTQICKTIVLCKEPWYVHSVYEGSIMNGYRKDCISEFQCAVRALLKTMEQFWAHGLDGFDEIYTRLWNEIWQPCRTLIFHPQNTMSEKEKRELLKCAIQTDAYQVALRHVSFHYPQHWSKRLAKEFLRFAMLHKWYLICYTMMKYISRMQQRKTRNLASSSI